MSDDFRPPARFPRLALKVNAVLLFAALLVGGFAWLVAHKQGWVVHQTMIRVITPDALGISTGMPVKLFGFTVGSNATPTSMRTAGLGINTRRNESIFGSTSNPSLAKALRPSAGKRRAL